MKSRYALIAALAMTIAWAAYIFKDSSEKTLVYTDSGFVEASQHCIRRCNEQPNPGGYDCFVACEKVGGAEYDGRRNN